jgi:DNA-3-methyladenine glycosylase II
MFSLARADIFPIDDLGIRNGMKKLVKKNMKPERMVKFAEQWKPYRTVASWYIWRNLENS